MTRTGKLILTAATAITLTACSSTSPLKNDTVTGQKIDNDPERLRVCCVNPHRPEPDPLDDPKNILAKRTIYFDYDRYNVKEEFRPLLEAHARYLNTHKSRSVVLTGHADERGGNEFNLALGQKRAEVVRKALAILGVSDAQMESVSYGEEKPAVAGSDEASWALNRRVELEYH